MEKIRSEAGRERDFQAGLFFLCGFLAGTIVPNLLFQMKWKQTAVSAVYLLRVFCRSSVSGMDYLLQVLRIRGGVLFLCLLGGITVFGVPLAVTALILAGFGLGALLAVSILQFGLIGGAVGLGLLFPQYLCYLPALLGLMESIYRQSGKLWKNQGLLRKDTDSYLRACILPLLLWTAGVLLEVWVNPWLLEKILNLVKIN